MQPLQWPGLLFLAASHLGCRSKVSLLDSRPIQQRSRSLPPFIVCSLSFIVRSSSVHVRQRFREFRSSSPKFSSSSPVFFPSSPTFLPSSLAFPLLPPEQIHATSILNVCPILFVRVGGACISSFTNPGIVKK
jgi:hypothetical protein